MSKILDKLGAIYQSAVNYIQPEPLAWEEFQAQLSEPQYFLNDRFFEAFYRFKEDPEYAGQLKGIAAVQDCNMRVFQRVDDEGRLSMHIQAKGFEATRWNYKADGTTYRGTYFRQLQHNFADRQSAVGACFAELMVQPEFYNVGQRAYAAYKRDAAIFERDHGALLTALGSSYT